MTTERQVQILAVLTTRNEAGQHFMQTNSYDDLMELEEAGLIEIGRPVHDTGIPYSQEYWTVQLTDDGMDLVEANQEYWPAN